MPDMLSIHDMLFQDLDEETYRLGAYKTKALQKRELVSQQLFDEPSLLRNVDPSQALEK